MAVIAIHGGAGGDGPWKGMTELDPKRVECLKNVIETIGSMLENDEISALDAARLAVTMMEDEELYNAGLGSVIAADGAVTMDASIMRGCDGAAGSIVNSRRLKNPINAAEKILQKGWPVMLNSEAADIWAIENGCVEVNNQDLITDLRKAQWKKWRASNLRPGATDEDDNAALDHDLDVEEDKQTGTVGAVVLDNQNRLAAATSTGGMTGKPDGRIGDTPIIGAGTWADTNVAVSCTGVGEAFIRVCAAHEVSSRHKSLVQHSNEPLNTATKEVLELVKPLNGRGGIIAVSKNGEVVMPFQTTLMYRASWNKGKKKYGIGPNIVEF